MSFILDALRKSEHERQRSAAPGLSHVPLATPRRELPGWALAVMGVLAAAVLVLAGAWWQSQRFHTAPPASSASVVAAPGASAPAPATAAAAPTQAPAPPAVTPAAPPPSPAGSLSASAQAAGPPPATSPTAGPPPVTPPSKAVTTPLAEPPPATGSAALRDVETPVEDRSQSLASAATVTRPAAPSGPTLPSVAALLAQGIDVPPLRLELHGYSDKPAERFVFINGHKYREGERLTEGPQVVAVEPNGVVLSQRGQRFLLSPE